MTNTHEIFPGEKIHYRGARHTWNNGFRRRWLANGARDAAVINAARRGDMQAVLARVDQMGGATARLSIARSIIKAAAKLESDVAGHIVERREDGSRMVMIPHLSWRFAGRRQVGVIEYLPMFGFRA